MRKLLLLFLTLLLGVTASRATDLTLTPANGTYVTSSSNYVNSITFSTTPSITVTASANNMDKRETSSYLLWHSGQSASSTYTISVGGDYVITGYTVTGEANTSAQTLTAGLNSHEFAVGTSSSFTVSDLKSSSVSFVQTGANASGLKITSISVTVAQPTSEQAAAYNTVQSWPTTIQGVKGLVKDASNYISNAKSSAEGTYPALLDGDYSTYFHGAYGSQDVPNEDQYLQATLPSAVDAIYFYFKKRSQNNANRPTSITISGSNDGSSFTNITTINSGLPTDGSVIDYTSSKISLGASYQYLRFTVTATNTGATHSNGHVFFTFSEFYILPSDTEVDDIMDLRVALAGTSAIDYTAEDIADIEAANTALLNTVVNVTYALYESDGETFVSNTVVEQTKNSAVSIPSAISSYTYYDYATEGTIGTTDCTIKVIRTLKSGYAISLGDLNSAKCYNIRNNRGTWAVGSGATDVNSTYELSLAFLASDTKQQFAFIYYDESDDETDNGKYYLYSVGEGKFAYVNGTKLSLTENFTAEVAASPVTFGTSTASSANNEPIIVTVGGQMFGVSTGKTPDVFLYNVANDGGNSALITEAGSFNAAAATALVEFYFTHTLTYVVKDESANTLFTSDPINIYKGTFNTLPTDYHRDYFFTYATDGVTINDESAANTNLEFVATPKDGVLQYTANTTSPVYYNLNIRSKYLAYNDEATGDVELLTSSTPFNPDAAWAFIGDPYTGFKIINQTNGTNKYLTYTSVVPGGNGGNNNIQFVAAGDFTNQYWYVEANSGGICLRMKENMNIYFHHDNTYHFLRTCSKTEWSDVHDDAGSTIVFASDEDVLVALYDELNKVIFDSRIGYYTWNGSGTAEEARANINGAGMALQYHVTSSYKDLYDALLEIRDNISLNTPAAGFYRLKNVATGKYLKATAMSSGFNDTNRYVYANGNATEASTVIGILKKDNTENLYMYNQGKGFGWVDASKNNGSGVVYMTSAPDKYIHWFPGTVSGQIAFAICLGNGIDSWASYLKKGIYTVDNTDEDLTLIGGTDETANAAQWVVEEATSVTVNLNSDLAGTPTYYATFCAPFSYTVSDGTTAYTLEDVGNGWLSPTAIEGEVAAGTPVLLKGTSATATLTIIGSSHVASPLTTTALTGTYLATTIAGASDYVFGISGGVVGFYHWNRNDLGANRAYIDTPAGVKGFVINWDDETGIQEVNGEGLKVKDEMIFNLAGQRVAKAQKGLYIVNGKKVMVK